MRDLKTGIGYRIRKAAGDDQFEISRITIDAISVAVSVGVGIVGATVIVLELVPVFGLVRALISGIEIAIMIAVAW